MTKSTIKNLLKQDVVINQYDREMKYLGLNHLTTNNKEGFNVKEDIIKWLTHKANAHKLNEDALTRELFIIY